MAGKKRKVKKRTGGEIHRKVKRTQEEIEKDLKHLAEIRNISRGHRGRFISRGNTRPVEKITDYKGQNAVVHWTKKPTARQMLRNLMKRPDCQSFYLRLTDNKSKTQSIISNQERLEEAERLVKEYDEYKKFWRSLSVAEKKKHDEEMMEIFNDHNEMYTPRQIREALMSEKVKGMEYARLMLSRATMHALVKFEERIKDENFHNVDLGNTKWVQLRIGEYLATMSRVGMFPSYTGLCLEGFGLTPERVNQYMATHDDQSTDLIKEARSTIANLLTEAALTGGANAPAAIFELKNNHGYSDTTVHVTAKADPLGTQMSEEEIAKKYLEKISFPAEVKEKKGKSENSGNSESSENSDDSQ